MLKQKASLQRYFTGYAAVFQRQTFSKKIRKGEHGEYKKQKEIKVYKHVNMTEGAYECSATSKAEIQTVNIFYLLQNRLARLLHHFRVRNVYKFKSFEAFGPHALTIQSGGHD